jgi:predicted nucleic acid-binding protein
VTVFVDTSALYALISATDRRHEEARSTFSDLLSSEPLTTHNYVELETISLVHARHGPAPVGRVREILDVIDVLWVDEDIHTTALDRLSEGRRRGPSLVDLVSFEVMERDGIEDVFAFDDHFADAGFHPIGA